MVQILPTGASLDDIRFDGEYVITDPAGGLTAGTYFVKVINSTTKSGIRFTQQIAYEVVGGNEYFRARFKTVWTAWLSRSSVIDLDGAQIVALLDDYFGSTVWRAPTDLSVGVHDQDSIEILSSTGDSVTIPIATELLAGLMSAEDKVALDNMIGGGADSVKLTIAALTSVNAYRAVAYDASSGKVRNANPASLGDSDIIVGIATNAAAMDDPVTIVVSGMLDGTFGFTPTLPVFVGLNGSLTQVPPSLPAQVFSRRVGVALQADTIYVQLEESVELS